MFLLSIGSMKTRWQQYKLTVSDTGNHWVLPIYARGIEVAYQYDVLPVPFIDLLQRLAQFRKNCAVPTRSVYNTTSWCIRTPVIFTHRISNSNTSSSGMGSSCSFFDITTATPPLDSFLPAILFFYSTQYSSRSANDKSAIPASACVSAIRLADHDVTLGTSALLRRTLLIPCDNFGFFNRCKRLLLYWDLALP